MESCHRYILRTWVAYLFRDNSDLGKLRVPVSVSGGTVKEHIFCSLILLGIA